MYKELFRCTGRTTLFSTGSYVLGTAFCKAGQGISDLFSKSTSCPRSAEITTATATQPNQANDEVKPAEEEPSAPINLFNR